MKGTFTASDGGFSLIELLVVIVVIGILLAIAMQSMTVTVEDARRIKTEREMEALTGAIVGDLKLTHGGYRGKFGYVGDVGAFPPNLQALYQNPGGYTTWNGPYLPPTFLQDSTGFKIDAWGAQYTYAGGMVITSTGGGTTLTRKIAKSANDYLLNTVNGTILDAANEVPGTTHADSINIVITFPDGVGSMTNKDCQSDSAGDFSFDSIPIGKHLLRVIYTPEVDTLTRYVTVLPRHKGHLSYRFASAYFMSFPSPVAYWRLDEISGLTADDDVGSNDGTLMKMFGNEWTTGQVGGALTLDGNNDYVDCGNDVSLQITDSVTVAVWVRANNFNDNKMIVTKTSASWADGWGLYSRDISGTKYVRFWINGHISNYAGTVAPSTGAWHHLVGTYDKSNIRIYVDGTEGTPSPYSNAISDSPTALTIGRAWFNPGCFDGLIDDVQIYDRALSAAEVQTLYEAGN